MSTQTRNAFLFSLLVAAAPSSALAGGHGHGGHGGGWHGSWHGGGHWHGYGHGARVIVAPGYYGYAPAYYGYYGWPVYMPYYAAAPMYYYAPTVVVAPGAYRPAVGAPAQYAAPPAPTYTTPPPVSAPPRERTVMQPSKADRN